MQFEGSFFNAAHVYKAELAQMLADKGFTVVVSEQKTPFYRRRRFTVFVDVNGIKALPHENLTKPQLWAVLTSIAKVSICYPSL